MQVIQLFATDMHSRLWELDPVARTETIIGDVNYAGIGALEYAFGDEQPRIKLPLVGQNVVPDNWTMNGILFGFSEPSDALLIIDASTGAAVKWPGFFDSINCQGLVFTTQLRDPYQPILVAGD